MSVAIRFSCDGHRHGNPCRGALHTHTTVAFDAFREAFRNGWRPLRRPKLPLLFICQSAHHDEETERA